MQKLKMVTVLFICMGMLLSLTACLTPAGRTAGQTVDDAAITAKVKARLIKDDVLKGFAISVKTFKGEVTLIGAVDSEEARKRAVHLARSTHGVRKVNNLIKIK
ncbi:MAG: BON domain-containing protein [Deltaproteobacteria bacterium]|nr:BON domain-containing protein [Deltaproteobacteria bacterium]MBW2084967.1 BON domain-containing protein [Deltaproteobacteria bacterium]